ncbi:MAG TPA: hypothetical protein VGC89_06080 [Pyrinomonadaceae bacterium]
MKYPADELEMTAAGASRAYKMNVNNLEYFMLEPLLQIINVFRKS